MLYSSYLYYNNTQRAVYIHTQRYGNTSPALYCVFIYRVCHAVQFFYLELNITYRWQENNGTKFLTLSCRLAPLELLYHHMTMNMFNGSDWLMVMFPNNLERTAIYHVHYIGLCCPRRRILYVTSVYRNSIINCYPSPVCLSVFCLFAVAKKFNGKTLLRSGQ